MPEKIDQINKLIKALPLPKKGLYKLKDNINLDDYIAILQSKRENKTYTIDASELGGSGTGIQSLTAGDNITVDNTDPLNPIVSASGGGSPAGSDTQIQYNNAGAFGADSGFFKGSETFGLGLLQTQQSAVTFTGTGVNNLVKSGTFSGTYPTIYTITIDGINKDCVNFPISSISGSGFQVGETLTSSSGGSATIDAINVNSNNSDENLVLSGVTGTFLSFDTITGSTSGTTSTPDSDLLQQDTYSWTNGTNSGSNVICKIPSGTNIQNGLNANFDTGISHIISDSWTWTYSKVQNNILDFSNNDYKFQSVFGTDTFGYQISDGTIRIGNLSGGNNTKITIDDVNEHITISNLPAYDDDTAAGVGGLTAGMVYMTTGSGSAPLNAAGILMIKQ